MEEVLSVLRSCILSEKDGVLLKNINRDYAAEVGSPIPYHKFGFPSITAFLQSTDTLVFTKNSYGEIVLKVAENKKTAHLLALVEKQKDKKKKKKARASVIVPKPTFRTMLHVKSTNEAQRRLYAAVVTPAMRSNVSSVGIDRRCATSKPMGSTDVRGYPLVSVSSKKSSDGKDVSCGKGASAQKIAPFEPLRVTVSSKGRRVDSVVTMMQGLALSQSSFPTVADRYRLVGDDFFVGLATEFLGCQYRISDQRMTSGLCRSGHTIKEAHSFILQRQTFPPRVLILIGAVDVIYGREFNDIAWTLYGFIRDLRRLVSTIAICTIPPLLFTTQTEHQNLLRVNALIKCVPLDWGRDIQVIDLYDAFTSNFSLGTMLQYYRHQTTNGLTAWNERGHKFVHDLLIKSLPTVG